MIQVSPKVSRDLYWKHMGQRLPRGMSHDDLVRAVVDKLGEWDTKLEAFAIHVEQDMAKEDLATPSQVHAIIVPGRKYTKVDTARGKDEVGRCGRFMVDQDTGTIYGIKAYGRIHKGKRYGTLDTVADYTWGAFIGPVKVVEAQAKMAPFKRAWSLRDNERILTSSCCPGRGEADTLRVVEQTLTDASKVYGILMGNVRIDCTGYAAAFDLFGNLIESGLYDVEVQS